MGTYELGIRTVFVLHLIVGAALYYLTALENDDLITVTNSAQAMSHDHAGATSAAQVVVDLLLRDGPHVLAVEVRLVPPGCPVQRSLE